MDLGFFEIFFHELFFSIITHLVPDLGQYSLGSMVTYGIPVPQGLVMTVILYTFAVLTVSLSLSGFIFNQREL